MHGTFTAAVIIYVISNLSKVAQSHNLDTLVPLPRETDPFVKTQDLTFV